MQMVVVYYDTPSNTRRNGWSKVKVKNVQNVNHAKLVHHAVNVVKIRVTRALTMVAIVKTVNNNRPTIAQQTATIKALRIRVGRTPYGANSGKFQIILLSGLNNVEAAHEKT